ncbi:metallophosphoesterase family protein [Bernardetia sp.]|uniref:metallophosphoesterase family protein n=1 Tax=Bernardetia sp. TaxID=1937974 RepID=UPI0025C72B1B|nr:exonuclease subunit SbcD [Bernardetia sp.]
MKILHTADWHLGKKLGDFSRLEEQKEVLDELCQIADAQNVDVVLIAGDLFDIPLPSNEANQLFLKTLQRLSKNASRPVVAIAGNHDSAQYIANFSVWGSELGIFLLGYPNDKLPKIKLESGLEILRSEEGFLELMMPHWEYPLRLLLTPYANELRLKTYFSLENQEQELREFLQEHWHNQTENYLDEKGINILMGHLFVMKKGEPQPRESDDEKSILVGSAQPIFTENFPKKNIQYVALGHLHRYHSTQKEPFPVVYSGSLLAYSFSEAFQKKYVVLLDAKANEPISYEKIELTNCKPLQRRTFSEVEKALEWLKEDQSSTKTSLIELTIETDNFLSAADAQLLYAAHKGIVGTIIPRIKGKKENLEAKIDYSRNMNELFVDFFKKQNNGQAPNKEIMQLFEEVKNREE